MEHYSTANMTDDNGMVSAALPIQVQAPVQVALTCFSPSARSTPCLLPSPFPTLCHACVSPILCHAQPVQGTPVPQQMDLSMNLDDRQYYCNKLNAIKVTDPSLLAALCLSRPFNDNALPRWLSTNLSR